jgi:hypothetical protein
MEEPNPAAAGLYPLGCARRVLLSVGKNLCFFCKDFTYNKATIQADIRKQNALEDVTKPLAV